jgi:hypothetical protein
LRDELENDMRGNLPVPSHRSRFAAAALFPAVRIVGEFLQTTFCELKYKVAAGINPAALATPVGYE